MENGLRPKRRVLLIEDSVDYQELFRFYTRKQCLDVTIASTGKQGLALLQEEAFDGIVLDYMLPDLSGREITSTLRNEPACALNRCCFTLLVSAVEMPQHRLRELYLQGIDLFLPKTFALRELANLVLHMCTATDARRQQMPVGMPVPIMPAETALQL